MPPGPCLRQGADRCEPEALGSTVCGIAEQVAVDFVGLWYAVRGGPHGLPLSAWRVLSDPLSRRRDSPVLIIFAKNAAVLGELLGGTHLHWIQKIPGYPTPEAAQNMKSTIT